MKYVYIICFLFIVSCQQNEQISQRTLILNDFKSNLIGKWGGFDKDTPIWKISTDSIYFYNDKRSYIYKLKDSSLFIEEISNIPMMKNITIDKDTLFFYSRASVDKEVYMLTKVFRHK